MKRNWLLATVVVMLSSAICHAHDAWVQTNTNLLRVGDCLHIDLLLGNHGNDHRDFKLAGKTNPASGTFELILPDGGKLDLATTSVDTGYAPQEGFWTTRFVAAKPGLYRVSHQSDNVMSYGPVRSIKGAKTYFVASPTLDRVASEHPGFDQPLGHALELVPLVNPVTPMGPGNPIRVRLLHKGQPLAETKVSFIPRGQTLAEGLDPTFERLTDSAGEATFTPTFGNYYLLAAHREAKEESGKGYERTKYSATLCILVPQVCPCCGD